MLQQDEQGVTDGVRDRPGKKSASVHFFLAPAVPGRLVPGARRLQGSLLGGDLGAEGGGQLERLN
jgi:hypothetical protein